MTELAFRRVLFVALLLLAPAVLFLVQVVFFVPTVLLLAGTVRMVPKWIGGGFGGENLTFVVFFGVHTLIFAGLDYLVAWLLGKVASRLPEGRPRVAFLAVLLGGLLGVTQLPLYGGGGHGPGKLGTLQDLLGDLDQSFGTGGVLTLGLVALGVLIVPLARTLRRKPA